MENNKSKSKENLEKAVALAYDNRETSPKIIAKGQGIVARNIIEKAVAEDITVYEDKELVNSLIGLEINEKIPVELYEAVAEIIFYVYNLDIKKGRLYDK
ncbi:EscU/YscU/HrcU family type III secretion system export apparatus switch protein [Tissierella sp.]|uniref:EscU/YscU/HrcU family type III secretion system export apparatus switch protein n=1 Tax=Tissierella sp. TaxID=41274 RepID=UPI0028651613|nr:EscU/YscU/HrcU family type III secretion system export apparatus switch protein [Tissierella sp.]MDR7856351.1 EscU/YscU/HrcU family type III secretion system export apparatus switch protein [Tissierella sp.]